ncbi:MAG: FAD binding domain-containing protein [Solirubrobacterales bacterium]
MIRTALTLHRPRSLEHAAGLLEEHNGEVAVLGGGTMLVPNMTRGEAGYLHLVDPVDLDLTRIEAGDDEVKIGARASYAQVLESGLIAERVPLLTFVAGGITGGPQVRNQGTIGGSACYANPSSDMPAVLVALSARFGLHGPEGRRTVAAAEFFRGPFEPDLRPGELLVDIAIPTTGAAAGYFKLKLCEASWPIVTGSALVGPEGSRQVTLGGVCATPRQLAVDMGEDLGAAVWSTTSEPWTDVLAPGSYRREVAAAVARRAIEMAENIRSGADHE